jgi:hypothetical protein
VAVYRRADTRSVALATIAPIASATTIATMRLVAGRFAFCSLSAGPVRERASGLLRLGA